MRFQVAAAFSFSLCAMVIVASKSSTKPRSRSGLRRETPISGGHASVCRTVGETNVESGWRLRCVLARHASVSQSRRRAGADHDGVELGRFRPRTPAAGLIESYVEAPYEFLELPAVTHWIPEQRPAEVATAIAHRARSVG